MLSEVVRVVRQSDKTRYRVIAILYIRENDNRTKLELSLVPSHTTQCSQIEHSDPAAPCVVVVLKTIVSGLGSHMPFPP